MKSWVMLLLFVVDADNTNGDEKQPTMATRRKSTMRWDFIFLSRLILNLEFIFTCHETKENTFRNNVDEPEI